MTNENLNISVADYYAVRLYTKAQIFTDSPRSDHEQVKYDNRYQREYDFYVNLIHNDVDEEDFDLIEESIKRIDGYIRLFKSELAIYDVRSRQTQLNDNSLRHYRSHFTNLKRAIEAKFAELKGEEIEQRGKLQHIKAIQEQIIALKAMKEQIDEQINALSKAL